MFEFVNEYSSCIICQSQAKKYVFTKDKSGWEASITYNCGCVCCIREKEKSIGLERNCPNAVEIVLKLRKTDIKVEADLGKELKT